jgi:protein TonB
MTAAALARRIALAALALPMALHAAPPAPAPAGVHDAVLEENQRRIDAMLARQERLMAQVREQLAAMPKASPLQLASDPQARAQEDRRQRLSRLLATIEQRVQEENARPRKRYLSPATLGALYAPYYNGMCRKIEASGAAHFPHAGGRKLYGSLLMALLIDHDGRLIEAQVASSSGNPTLDRLARDIARRAAPFDPFTPEMREDADQIDIVTRFSFRRVADGEPDRPCGG